MTGLTPDEIAGMRQTVVDVQLDMLCTVQRRDAGFVKDPNGAPIYAWADLYVDVPCHYWPQANIELAGVLEATVTREQLVLEARTDIRTTDRISEVLSVDGEQVAGTLDIEEVLPRLNDVLLRVKGNI